MIVSNLGFALAATGIGIVRLLSLAFLWQVKEYRLDRMRAHFMELRLASIPLALLTLSYGAGLFTIMFISECRVPASADASLVALAAMGTYHALQIRRQGVLRPDMTLKAGFIVTTALIATGIIEEAVRIRYTVPFHVSLVLIILGMHLIVALSVGTAEALSYIPKKRAIARAKQIREVLPHLMSIGITGSVGKTSTKTYLMHLLAETFPHARATKGHVNSEFPVARDMLEQLTKTTNLYIAEMGAYHTGEIKALTELVKPRHGVITRILSQHRALFGDSASIMKAKWELIDSLPESGVAILNADDPLIRSQAAGSSRRIVWFSTHEPADVYASDIDIRAREIQCSLHIGKEIRRVRIPVVSEGLLTSVVAACAAAYVLGAPPESMFSLVETLPVLPRAMEIRRGIHDATVIDDSYSAGELAVLNAIKHIDRFSSTDKRIVLVPIIELGSEGPRVHDRMGAALAKTGARVYVYGNNYDKDIMRGFTHAGGSSKIAWYVNPRILARDVCDQVRENTLILLEGRVPRALRDRLIQH